MNRAEIRELERYDHGPHHRCALCPRRKGRLFVVGTWYYDSSWKHPLLPSKMFKIIAVGMLSLYVVDGDGEKRTINLWMWERDVKPLPDPRKVVKKWKTEHSHAHSSLSSSQEKR